MSPRLLDLGNKIMIGKGKRDAAVKEAVVRNGAGLSGRAGRCRCADGPERQDAGSHRVARPRL